MRQSILILSTILLVLFVFAGAYVFRTHTFTPIHNSTLQESTLRVVATFYPLGEFARQVGGDFTHVSVIVPAGSEPHEYEPTPQDIASAYSADVLLVNGAGMDAWAMKIRPDLEHKGVKVVVMSELLGFDNGYDIVSNEEDSPIDPHFWLDPILAQKEVLGIRDAFVEVDTKNQDLYTTHAKMYAQALQELDQLYQDTLAICKNKTIITSHSAFGYVSKRYGFEVLSIAGLSPEIEPSTRQLADLVVLAKDKYIKYIFFETLASPRLAQTLADEIGAQTLVFNPLEGLTDDEIAQGKNYISVMRDNVNNLIVAMNCHE